MPTDPGALFECRIARLYFAEGAFVRRRVNLDVHFNERFTVTDADILSFRFDQTLALTLEVAECKATEAKNSPSSADRLLWLVGLRQLLNAHRSSLASHRSASDVLRSLASDLGSEVLDLRDIARREAEAGLGQGAGFGSHDPQLLGAADDVLRIAKGDDELRRVYWFVRSELWLLPPVAAIKKALGGCRIVANRWSENMPAQHRDALRWITSELVTGFALAVTRIASVAFRQPEDVFERYLHDRLSEGITDYAAMEEISGAVDRYLMAVLREAGVDPAKTVSALGTFAPVPPAYLAPLSELIQRVSKSPKAAVDLARLSDWRHASMLRGSPDSEAVFVNEAETARLLRLIASFLARQTRLPEDLLEPITAVPAPAAVSNDAVQGAGRGESSASGRPTADLRRSDAPTAESSHDDSATTGIKQDGISERSMDAVPEQLGLDGDHRN